MLIILAALALPLPELDPVNILVLVQRVQGRSWQQRLWKQKLENNCTAIAGMFDQLKQDRGGEI